MPNRSQQLSYPSEGYDYNNAPFVLFRQIEAEYESNFAANLSPRGRLGTPPRAGGRRSTEPPRSHVIRQYAIPTDDAVSMYMPVGFQMQDAVTWEMEDTGGFGRVAQSLLKGTVGQDLSTVWNAITDGGLKDANVSSILTGHGDKGVAALVGTATSRLGSSTAGKAIGGLLGVTAGIAGGNVFFTEARKDSQATINPRQFMLFRSPNIRNFNLEFHFVPTSQHESDMVQNIIRWFRVGLYPEITNLELAYIFPAAFIVEFHNMGNSIPNLPELALQSVDTNYNPDTMAYFESNNRPVEIRMTLAFSELQPLHKDLVARGGY